MEEKKSISNALPCKKKDHLGITSNSWSAWDFFEQERTKEGPTRITGFGGDVQSEILELR